jgi:Phage tail protein (Tail_P2_I)
VSTPELTPWGERLRERTAPLAPDDAEHGNAHAHLAGALATALERVAQIYDPDDGPPGSPLVDVDRCPDWALPWLAQLVGVVLPPGVDAATARVLISDVAGWRRGTPAALRAAAGLHLTGDKSVYFRERDATGADPPYTLEVVTLTSETPEPDAVLAALLAQKPGGIVLTYRTVTGWDYQAMTTEGQAEHWTYASLPPLFDDYYALTADERTP